MAAKNGITWPLNTTIQAHTHLLAIKHKLAESTEINQFLAESANSANGFHRLLTRSEHFTAHESTCDKADLSGKFRFGSNTKIEYYGRGGH
jgi:hypothetical protein